MIGAIIGDIIGSRFEHKNTQSTQFDLFTDDCHFTDDTVCTIATMDWLNHGGKDDYAVFLSKWILQFPKAGFSRNMLIWASSEEKNPYGSFGNGAAMRVSPVAWASTTEGGCEVYARRVASVSHNHLEGIKGACAIADCVLMSRLGYNKKDISELIERKYGYDLGKRLDQVVQEAFDTCCQKTVPAAIISFFSGGSFEEVVRKAVSLGGDSDTIASMAGAIADAYFGVPKELEEEALTFLPSSFRDTVDKFKENVNKSWENYISFYTEIPGIIEHRKTVRSDVHEPQACIVGVGKE